MKVFYLSKKTHRPPTENPIVTPKPRKNQISANVFKEQKNLLALIKAVSRFFPWSEPYGKTKKAWDNIAEDVNKALQSQGTVITGPYARDATIKALDNHERDMLSSVNGGNQFISGHSFPSAAVTAELITLSARKKTHDEEAVRTA